MYAATCRWQKLLSCVSLSLLIHFWRAVDKEANALALSERDNNGAIIFLLLLSCPAPPIHCYCFSMLVKNRFPANAAMSTSAIVGTEEGTYRARISRLTTQN